MQRTRGQRGFTLIELLIVMAIILVIAAVAVPQLGKQLMAAHENAVVQTIVRTLHPAEVQYYSQFGTYATSLTQLGPPASGAAGPAAADLIPRTLADGHSSGYIFTLTSTSTGYAISAVPEEYGKSGSRTFYSDQTLVVRNNYSQEPATPNSPAIGTPIAPTK
jgi:type IV pilus assembly protein PilA